MIKKAISKLKDEMDKHKNNSYIQVVGEFLLKHLDINPGAAEKILDKEKTIEKSLEAMRKAAQKKKVGNCAVLTDQEGFEIVLKYYGIVTKEANNVTKTAESVTKTPKNVTKSTDNVIFDVKLEDLL